jgi:hypothetical protein
VELTLTFRATRDIYPATPSKVIGSNIPIFSDDIDQKYSMASAKAFNSAVGSAFANEPDFPAALKVLTFTYKKTTNVTLKF